MTHYRARRRLEFSPSDFIFRHSLTLKCTLLGHPKPTVTWEKDGELVDEERTDGHIRTAIDGNNYFLEIEQCRAGDGGRYAVTARNSLGKQMAGVDVTVSGGSRECFEVGAESRLEVG